MVQIYIGQLTDAFVHQQVQRMKWVLLRLKEVCGVDTFTAFDLMDEELEDRKERASR